MKKVLLSMILSTPTFAYGEVSGVAYTNMVSQIVAAIDSQELSGITGTNEYDAVAVVRDGFVEVTAGNCVYGVAVEPDDRNDRNTRFQVTSIREGTCH